MAKEAGLARRLPDNTCDGRGGGGFLVNWLSPAAIRTMAHYYHSYTHLAASGLLIPLCEQMRFTLEGGGGNKRGIIDAF